MTALAAYIKAHATGRAVAAAMMLCLLLAVLLRVVLVPYFKSATGFVPFDMQFPLSHYTIPIQLGAYGNAAAGAYLPFLMVDLLLASISAGALMLLWGWLFRAPSAAFGFFERGGIFLVPIYTLVCDVCENVAFARLVARSLAGEAYADAIQFAVIVHRLRGALLDLQVILTVTFVIIFAVACLRRSPGEPAQ